ncbi:MAG: hypothetical protein ACRERU_21635 [Methylococcales bacterium]
MTRGPEQSIPVLTPKIRDRILGIVATYPTFDKWLSPLPNELNGWIRDRPKDGFVTAPRLRPFITGTYAKLKGFSHLLAHLVPMIFDRGY